MIVVNEKPINITRFPDGTSQVWKLDSVGDTATVRWRFQSEDEVIHLAQLAALLDSMGVSKTLEIDYLPYARQDKPIGNDSTFALRVFAPMLNAMGWKEVVLHDPHSEIAEALIERTRVSYFAHEAVLCMKATGADLLCFPDAGALAKYKPLFWGVPHVSAEKGREPLTGRVTTGLIHGEVAEAKVLIVDDICDGGATFIGLAAKLREAGAVDVFLFVSHGLFTRGVNALTGAGISRVFIPTGEVFA